MRGAVGIVGRGRIASALIDGLKRRPDLVSDLFLQDSLSDMVGRGGMVVVDVPSADLQDALDHLRPLLDCDLALVSAVEGLSLRELRAAAGPGPALLRAVATPGTGTAWGVLVLCAEPGTEPGLSARVAEVLQCGGPMEMVPEDMLEAAVAVASSSTGLLALAMEGIEDGAVQAGLPRDTARAFVRQTAHTTALLLRGHPGSPADLKDQVASPAGTTIAGLAALEGRAVRGACIRAVLRAGGREP